MFWSMLLHTLHRVADACGVVSAARDGQRGAEEGVRGAEGGWGQRHDSPGGEGPRGGGRSAAPASSELCSAEEPDGYAWKEHLHARMFLQWNSSLKTPFENQVLLVEGGGGVGLELYGNINPFTAMMSLENDQ